MVVITNHVNFSEYLKHARCMRQAQTEYESCVDVYQLRIKTLNKVKSSEWSLETVRWVTTWQRCSTGRVPVLRLPHSGTFGPCILSGNM